MQHLMPCLYEFRLQFKALICENIKNEKIRLIKTFLRAAEPFHKINFDLNKIKYF